MAADRRMCLAVVGKGLIYLTDRYMLVSHNTPCKHYTFTYINTQTIVVTTVEI